MRNIFILLVLCILPHFLNAETNATANFSHKDEVYHYLKEELKSGYSHGDEGQAMKMDRVYLSIVGEEIRQHLEQNGFKFLDKKTFKDKIKNIFSLDEKQFLDQSNYDYVETISLPFSISYLRFLPNKSLLTLPYKMPDIIDYQKQYPELVKLENNANTTYVESGNTQQRVSWKVAHKDYTKFTKDNRSFVLALNRYLLNDDFSQRSWLVENTYGIMHDVYLWGYSKKDKGLLKALLKEKIYDRHKSIEWHNSAISTNIKDLLVLPKNNAGQYVVREEAFVYLSKFIRDEDKRLSQLDTKWSKDGSIRFISINKYRQVLKDFVSQYKNSKGYESTIEYILKCIEKETPCKPN